MYLKKVTALHSGGYGKFQPKHEMYLNKKPGLFEMTWESVQPKHDMYLNSHSKVGVFASNHSNRNIRCI